MAEHLTKIQKMIRFFPTFILILLCCSTATVQAQNQPNYWTKKSVITESDKRYSHAEKYLTRKLDVESLRRTLQGADYRDQNNRTSPITINIPHPNGEVHNYQVFKNHTMHPDLQEKYPEIRSYDGISPDRPGELVKFEVTPLGFHAVIFTNTESVVYIHTDPSSSAQDHYLIYYDSDLNETVQQFKCGTITEINEIEGINMTESRSFGDCELRTYSLALAATGEYTAYYGGTKALALAAQVTVMNTVNGIFERTLTIILELVPNNDDIIYLNAASDPYSNGAPSTMLGENKTTCDGVIGSANYDIGHVFGTTNSGGLGGLGVVCGSVKAWGVVTSNNPSGSWFWKATAHEMGHQFGANHTQNNACNRNDATAMEPGSGSTLMGYPGVCSPNVKSSSDPHFHGISVQEMSTRIGFHSCPVTTVLANSAPVITSMPPNVTIPASTPFALTATVTDVDGDALTYLWDQMDNEIISHPPASTATEGPVFQDFPPASSPTRYIPKISRLIAGGPFTWERLPSVSRTLNFRVIVYDNAVGGGCNDDADMILTVDDGAGPFLVTYPSLPSISWIGLSSETVTWDVANTDNAPVSCANVDILISTDWGGTWNVVASSVPNDGSHLITVPNTPASDAFLMVQCDNGTFFDISDDPFEITAASDDYVISMQHSSIRMKVGKNLIIF